MIAIPSVVTVAGGAGAWFLGRFLVNRISILNRYNLPAPVIGGLLIAVVLGILHSRGAVPFSFDTQLVPALMIGFFTSLGYGASFRELKRGGSDVLLFLGICSLLLLAQIAVGMAVASALGMPRLFGLLTSAVSLVGGPGTALSFAPMFEQAGVDGAAATGLAAAMVGIVLGGVLGSPLATILIKRHRLQPASESGSSEASPVVGKISEDQLPPDLLYHSSCLLIIGAAGWYLSQALTGLGIVLPFYIGSMLLAMIVRNIDDTSGIFCLRPGWFDAIGSTCLTFFIAVSMMTLELWNLAAIAGPLLICLIAQATLVVLFAALITFWVAGRDYEAAVISGGLVGFMLGTTANALATMKAIADRFGPAPRAFLVVPLVGACFIDFVNALVISVALNLLR